MKISDIDSKIKISDFENFFNVYENSEGFYNYNLNATVYLDIGSYNTFVIKTKCFWPLVSYQLYNTTRLAWLLMKINNVRGKDVFKQLQPGDKIKYLPNDVVSNILQSL